MKIHRIGLVGFGGVARGFCQVLAEKHTAIMDQFGIDVRIVAICTRSGGTLCCGQGFPLQDLIQEDWRGQDSQQENWDAMRMIQQVGMECMVELTPTSITDAQPALDHCRLALRSGLHVITANKGPIALAGGELRRLASDKGRFLGVEACVMAGTPTMHLCEIVKDQKIIEIRGILNGTTNYILGEMEKGLRFDDALASAQLKGYAEPDPTADIEGLDVLAKVLILANSFMGLNLAMDQVPCRGISDIRLDSVQAALDHGKRWKLLGIVDEKGARVEPDLLPVDAPLACVSGTLNAISLKTEFLQEITLSGPGAGPRETGYGVYHDLCRVLAIQ